MFYLFTPNHNCVAYFQATSMVKEIMGKRGVSTLCNNLLKKLTRDDFLSGCRRVVAPDFVKRGTSSFHTLTSSNQTPQLCQKHQSSQVCHLPQLDVPDVPADLFKGMSTEFPCLTRKYVLYSLIEPCHESAKFIEQVGNNPPIAKYSNYQAYSPEGDFNPTQT